MLDVMLILMVLSGPATGTVSILGYYPDKETCESIRLPITLAIDDIAPGVSVALRCTEPAMPR